MKYTLPLLILAIIIVGVRYQQYGPERAFLIKADVPCDPSRHSCFAADCAGPDIVGCNTTPYKKAVLLAHDAPGCLEEHACSEFSCAGRRQCSITYCASEQLEDGEHCTGPFESR